MNLSARRDKEGNLVFLNDTELWSLGETPSLFDFLMAKLNRFFWKKRKTMRAHLKLKDRGSMATSK